MPTLLITDIKGLAGTHLPGVLVLRGAEMKHLPTINNSWLFIEEGLIADFGEMSSLPRNIPGECLRISAKGKYVLPAWCDSHTHLVFAASREEEFVMKIKGKSYEEIAAAGGGILNSAEKVHQATERELFAGAFKRLDEVIKLGTGAIEIKSGYGLSIESELKMLRVIRRIKEVSPVPVKATFLGAHAFPETFKKDHEGYIRILINDLLPQISGEGLADFIDVFCEQGFFSPDETSRILEAGSKVGLKAKMHANQLSATGAVETGVKYNALSVDHLEMMNDSALNSLQCSNTIATLLPSCSLFLGIPFADAKSLLKRNIAVAIASDYNPGSTPSGNMNLVVSLACMRLKMLPGEAINAATLNGAAAMELSHSHGSITRGKAANFIITKTIPSLDYLPYSFGSNQIDKVYINGKAY
jgi:imidazolonepropionase